VKNRVNGVETHVTMSDEGMVRATTMGKLWLAVVTAAFAAGACDGEQARPADGAETECVGAKCDVPVGEGEDLCEGRRSAAFTEGKEAFTPSALRWSCNDVPGVTAEDRGQEYCEYWAILETDSNVHELGRVAPGGRGELPVHPELSDDELSYLEDADRDTIVGACVFSSWNRDKDASCSDCDDLLGLPVDREHFQARISFNSFGAAKDILERCSDGTAPDGGLRDDPFFQGCLHADDMFGTGWRKSDATICSAAVEMSECSCRLTTGGSMVDLGLPSEPGFHLGSWEAQNSVPEPCHYIKMDDDESRVLVACEVTAGEALDNMHDLKQWCREGYGERIVVHVPIEPSVVECDESCGQYPWVLTDD